MQSIRSKRTVIAALVTAFACAVSPAAALAGGVPKKPPRHHHHHHHHQQPKNYKK